MSQDATAATATEGESSSPVIGKNLFWDDMRIGLNVFCIGLIILLIVAVIARWVLPEMLVAVLSGLAALVVIAGMKICCSVPEETGVNSVALGAKGCALLCLLGCAAAYFVPFVPSAVGSIAATLGGLAHVAFAFVLMGAAKYLQLRFLSLLSTVYLMVAAVVTLVFLLLLWTGGLANPGLRILVDLVAIVAAAFLMCNAVQLSQAIKRGQQDLPMETTKQPAETETTGESADEHEDEESHETPAFGEKQVSVFHSEDFKAAKAVVYLLTGVFSVGVVLYTIVALTCVM